MTQKKYLDDSELMNSRVKIKNHLLQCIHASGIRLDFFFCKCNGTEYVAERIFPYIQWLKMNFHRRG